ncbi:MAG: SGNH/GDSL hydrolase family protein [Nitrospirales bacterium]
MKNFLFALILTLFGILFSLVILEGYVRITQTDGQNFDIEMWRYAKDLKRVSSIPGMGHEHVPNQSGTYMGIPVSINSHGWRDQEYTLEKPSNVIRIMMLGDSVTFGWGAPPEGVTSNLLENRLNQDPHEKHYQVLNTGIGNSNTAMQVAYFLHTGYRFQPDIVVLNYFINDAEPTPTRKENVLIENLYSAVYLAGRIDIVKRTYLGHSDWKTYYQNLYRSQEPGWLAAQEAISRLSDFCKQHGIALLLAHYPELHELAPYPFQNVQRLLLEEAQKDDIPFVDLLPSVIDEDPSSLWVTPTDAHPNGKAGERFAETLHVALKQNFPRFF